MSTVSSTAQRPEDIALIIYTSGSTGKPKGAMISYAQYRRRGARRHATGWVSMRDSTTLSYLPLCHVAEQMLTDIRAAAIRLAWSISASRSAPCRKTCAKSRRRLFLGVPRIWEKLHSAIHIKMQESGPLSAVLIERAFAACEPFAHEPAPQRTSRERLTFALCYWLVFRALQNFIGLRRARIALTGAAPIPPSIVHVLPHAGHAADRGLRA